MLWCSGAVRWPTLERYRLLLAKFKACKDLWLGAARLAQQDGRVGVVLLHGGVRLCEEAPDEQLAISSANDWHPAVAAASCADWG